MNMNLTLLGQMITFALFVWFTMRFVWPPVMQALVDRQKKIAEGLAAGERGVHDLQLAQHKAADMLREAKVRVTEMIGKAEDRANHIVDEAKEKAKEEGAKLIALAKLEIEQETVKARQKLRDQVASIAVLGAERILGQRIDLAANQTLLRNLIDEI